MDNLTSQAVLRRTGFTLIGRAAGYLRIADRWRDHLLYQRLADDPGGPASPRRAGPGGQRPSR